MADATILVVEDDTALLEGLRDILELSSYHVFTARNGVEGLAALQNRVPDLIVSDINMPRMDGYQFYAHVRARPESRRHEVYEFVRTQLDAGRLAYIVYPLVEESSKVDLKAATLVPILQANIDSEARVMTDEAGQYVHLRKHFAEHGVVDHGAEEYVHPDDGTIHTNTIEGFFSIFKRGMKGIYQHCGKEHLHRYVAEFDFRYSNRAGLGRTFPLLRASSLM